MTHLEAIKERNAKPVSNRRKSHDEGMEWLAGEWRRQDIMREAISPLASIDAAPLPEYMQGR
jgi:hypothetical protein